MGASQAGLRALMVGLDGAGKTTILYKLKLGEMVVTQPTMWFNTEQLQYKKTAFTVWDMGGQERSRWLWQHYYKQTQILIFVVDASDRERIDSAASILAQLVLKEELNSALVLILANKCDLPGSMQIAELSRILELYALDREWHIQKTSGMTGEGLYEGLDYVASAIPPSPEIWNPFRRSVSVEDTGTLAVKKELRLMQLWQRISPIILFVWANKESALHSSAFSLSRAICDFLSPGIASDLLLSQEEVQRIVQLFTKTAFFENVTGIKAAKKKDQVPSLIKQSAEQSKDLVFLHPKLERSFSLSSSSSSPPSPSPSPSSSSSSSSFSSSSSSSSSPSSPSPSSPSSASFSSSSSPSLSVDAMMKSGVDHVSDAELLRWFESSANDNPLHAHWNHIVFLRVIYLYLARQGRQACAKKVLDGMEVLQGNCFNTTVCYFWIQIVDYSCLIDMQAGISAPYPANNNNTNSTDAATASAVVAPVIHPAAVGADDKRHSDENETRHVSGILSVNDAGDETASSGSNEDKTQHTHASRASGEAANSGTNYEMTESSGNSNVSVSGDSCNSDNSDNIDSSDKSGDSITEFHLFLLRHPYLLQDSLISQYYSDKVGYDNLSSRFELFLPDLKALPSIVSFSQRESSPLNTVHFHLQTEDLDHFQIVGLSDEALVRAVRSSSSASSSQDAAKLRKEWSHAHLTRFIFEVLSKEGRGEGTSERIVKDLDRLLGDKHHVTITYFWIQMIDYCRHKRVRFENNNNNMRRTSSSSSLSRRSQEYSLGSPRSSSEKEGSSSSSSFVDSVEEVTFEMVFDNHPELRRESLFLDYFSHELMFNNAKAQNTLVLPDLQRLPSFLLPNL